MMRHILFAVLLVVACVTGAAADSYDDAVSALKRDDNALAARLFRSLAEKGHAGAQSHLGILYAHGEGVTQDYQVAGQWYRKAAEQGDERAQYNLGLMYTNGQGIPQGFIRAYMWSHLAAATSSGSGAIEVKKLQGDVTSRMTAAQIEKAQEMARRCQDTKFKECD